MPYRQDIRSICVQCELCATIRLRYGNYEGSETMAAQIMLKQRLRSLHFRYCVTGPVGTYRSLADSLVYTTLRGSRMTVTTNGQTFMCVSTTVRSVNEIKAGMA